MSTDKLPANEAEAIISKIKSLVKKYDKQGPRYTSYPPVPFWKDLPTSERWADHLKVSYDETKGVDIYVHIPYCQELCYFCGCHKVIKKTLSIQDPYLDALILEWKQYKKIIPNLKINSLHFGGGTPTFLTPKSFVKFLDVLKPSFTDSFIGSIEVDPRTTFVEHLDVFKEYNISRISMGIQDFNLEVQQKINRIQPFELVQKLSDEVRKRNFHSLNFDLIYGLPMQDWQKMEKTIDLTMILKPDMIAFYSYAHVPWKIKSQNLIKEEELLLGEDKLNLYLQARQKFARSGYVEIGLDHFARVNSPLDIAQKNKKLLRNFMGYVDQKSNMIIGLGVSSISSSSKSFVQNEKVVSKYIERVKNEEIPFCAGHTHQKLDLIVEDIIQDIMCNGQWDSPIEFPGITEIEEFLEDMIKDQLLIKSTPNDNQLNHFNYKVTETGRPFLRNMAMLYDFHLSQKQNESRFSRTI